MFRLTSANINNRFVCVTVFCDVRMWRAEWRHQTSLRMYLHVITAATDRPTNAAALHLLTSLIMSLNCRPRNSTRFLNTARPKYSPPLLPPTPPLMFLSLVTGLPSSCHQFSSLTACGSDVSILWRILWRHHVVKQWNDVNFVMSTKKKNQKSKSLFLHQFNPNCISIFYQGYTIKESILMMMKNDLVFRKIQN